MLQRVDKKAKMAYFFHLQKAIMVMRWYSAEKVLYTTFSEKDSSKSVLDVKAMKSPLKDNSFRYIKHWCNAC